MMARTTQGKGRAIALVFAAAGFAVLVGSTALANPFSAIGENMHVYLIGGMSVRYDDNLFLSSVNKQSDIVTRVNAGVEFEYGGRDTPNAAKVMFAQNWFFYRNRSENNAKHLSFRGEADYVGSRGSVSASASMTPNSYNTRDELGLGGLVQSVSYSASVNGTYNLTGKTRFSGGITYRTTEYATEGYSNQATVTVPVRVLYEVTAKTGVRAGYTYRATFITDFPDQNSQDHTISIGTTREISSTISGDIEIGMTHRQLSTGESGTIIPIDGTLSWVATPRMVYTAYARRDFGNSALAGSTYLQTLVGLRMGYDLAERWNAGAGLAYEIAEYYNSERVDNYWTGNLDLSYAPSRFMSMSAGYVYRMNQSTVEQAEFDNNQLTFSLNARY
jgi:hypothetical protein